MALFVANNHALESAASTLTAGQSYATGAKCAIQVQVPDNQVIRVVEFGWAQDVVTATSTLLSLQTTDTGSTLGTAHSTTTVKPLMDRDARASSMTMATTGTSYGAASITARTTLRNIASLYVPQTYVFQWPLGQWPLVGSGTGENFLQLNVNTTATVNAICWIVWDEA
jgi:hypothetical protein